MPVGSTSIQCVALTLTKTQDKFVLCCWGDNLWSQKIVKQHLQAQQLDGGEGGGHLDTGVQAHPRCIGWAVESCSAGYRRETHYKLQTPCTFSLCCNFSLCVSWSSASHSVGHWQACVEGGGCINIPVLGVAGATAPFWLTALEGVPGTEEESDPMVHWSRGTDTWRETNAVHSPNNVFP